MSLEKELEVFEQHRSEWCESNLGKFAVIQDDTVVDEFFSEWGLALRAGYRNFGADRPFLVKQILYVDPVHFVGSMV
jgi:hypothetical protein